MSYERRGAIGLVTLQRPEAMNAFDYDLRRELAQALRAAAFDDSRVVVLSGERAFSAGADVKQGFPADGRVSEMLNNEYGAFLRTIVTMDKPVIAAVRGVAAGIGMSLALACDLLVMTEDAFLLPAFTTIGLVPDGGATWLLARQIGYRRAFAACVEAQSLDAPRCLELGLANRVVPADVLIDETMAWAQRLAQRAPLAVSHTKRAMRAAMECGYFDAARLEAAYQDLCARSEDGREGVDAFLEKREPRYQGR